MEYIFMVWYSFGRSPVQFELSVDAREPPSQLQEALKENTEVNAEYN
jgi:hypothetical protein